MAICCDYCGLPISPDVVDDAMGLFADHLEHAHDIPDANPIEHTHEC